MTTSVTGFQVNADINPFEQSMRRLVESARNGQAGVSSAFGKLDGLKTLFAGIAVSFGAIKFTEFVKGTMDAAGGLKDLSQKTGMTVESLSGLSSVAKLSGTSLDSIAGASNKLSLALSGANEDSKGVGAAIGALGLNFRDFQALSPEDRMLAVAKAMAGFEDGASKTAVAMALFGRGGAEMLPMLNDLAEVGMLNAKITTAQAEAADQFGDDLVKLNAQSGKWKTTLVMGMAPALAEASSAFLSVVKQSGGLQDQIAQLSADGSIQKWTRAGVVALSYLADGLVYVGKIFGTVIATLGTAILQATSTFSGLFTGISKAMSGDFSGAAEAMKQGFEKASKYGQSWKADMVELWSGDTIGKKMRDAMAKGTGDGGTTKVKQKLEFDNVSTKEKASKEASQMPIYEAELSKKIALFEKEAQAEGTLRQFSKAEEATYWKEVSQRAALSAEDKSRAEKKWRDLERGLRTEAFTVEMADLEQRKQAAQNNFAQRIQLAEQAHTKTVAMYGAESKEAAAAMGKVLEEKRRQVQQLQQLQDIANQRTRDKALGDVEFDKQDASHKLALGLITQQQLLVQEAQFEERMHAIKLQYLQLAQAAVDPQKDPVKKAEVDAQLEQLELQHQLRLGQIKNQIAQQQDGPMDKVAKSMESSFEQAVTGMLTRAQTLRQSLGNIFSSVHAAFVQEMVAKPLAMMAVRVIRESAMYQALAGVQVTSQGTASGAVAGIKGTETTAVGGMNAVQAGTGAFAALAAIPIVGPALAAVAGPAMFATVMAMVARSAGGGGGGTTTTTTRIPSASGGFDIPRGLNPLTQLHEQEMVLPAHIANPLRDSLAQGGGGAASGGDGGTVVINATGGDFIHKRDLAKVLTAMKRDFKFTT